MTGMTDQPCACHNDDLLLKVRIEGESHSICSHVAKHMSAKDDRIDELERALFDLRHELLLSGRDRGTTRSALQAADKLLEENRMDPAPLTSIIEAPTGGVMATRAGAMTGPVIIRTTPTHAPAADTQRELKVEVAYEGTDDFQTVAGSPVTVNDDHTPAHARICLHLSRQVGDIDGDGNDDPTTVRDLPVQAS